MYFYANIFIYYFANPKLYSIWNHFWCMQSILRKTLNLQLLYHGRVFLFMVFFIVAYSILIVYVVMLENDDVFKLPIYLNICFFHSCVGILPTRSVKTSLLWSLNLYSIHPEVFIDNCPNKASKVLSLKLTADLIKSYQQHWHYRKCLIVSLKLFPTC